MENKNLQLSLFDLKCQLEEIQEKVTNIAMQIRLENKVYSLELEDRLEKGLQGDEAIKHYNEWMQRYHLEYLMVKD